MREGPPRNVASPRPGRLGGAALGLRLISGPSRLSDSSSMIQQSGDERVGMRVSFGRGPPYAMAIWTDERGGLWMPRNQGRVTITAASIASRRAIGSARK
jgi:hypothetical protein